MTAVTWVGSDHVRLDGTEKVRGEPIYGADRTAEAMTYAVPVGATVGRGRITALDTAAAERVPGVLAVFTYENLDRLHPADFAYGAGSANESSQPMQDPVVAYRGQPIALVVAETLEAAADAAALVTARYEVDPFTVELDDPAAESVDQAQEVPAFPAVEIGAGDRLLDQAPVVVDATYVTPAQHHNALELLSTVAQWRDGTLLIQEGTQAAGRVRHALANQLGMPMELVQTVSPSLGGGFGQRTNQTFNTVLAAVAARRVGRPVKLVVPRADVFHSVHFRPATRHRIRLGAQDDGTITTLVHDIHAQTSRHDLMPFWGAETSSRMYAIPNFRSTTSLVRLDTQTPGYMRAPMEMATMFAVESALDELAARLRVDPVELRRRHDTAVDPVTGKPFSSRRLLQCLERGADRFGWSRRDPTPGSMRSDDGSLVGWGMAAGSYPCLASAAASRVRLHDDGTADVTVSGHEMGQGLRTVVALAAAESLGLPPGQIRVTVGDTRAVPQPETGGSWGTATAVPAVLDAVDGIRARLHQIAATHGEAVATVDVTECRLADGRLVGPDNSGPPVTGLLTAAGLPSVEADGQYFAPGQKPTDVPATATARKSAVTSDVGSAFVGPEFPAFVTCSYIAHFVEVQVGARVRRPRVTRMLSVVDCGRVISRRTATSQALGGLVWGIGTALTEESIVDPRYGGFLNNNLADYEVPVNADVPTLDVDFVDEPDPSFGAFGLKGLGEVVHVGAAAAITNAIYHATGIRVRELPVRVENLMADAAR
ncbi:xanthine dehydrogenase family protein molybdopterin-binding subunit [Micromonospora sp. WMMA1363]|uniref:xanthine dehydrogenase family protein molybdopterin-binding subunit n=1 Tax=Micromonospora sp. WMMA1363 TaxID=3053985 RepID=UPI00259CC9A6|nr:xanthine dehydrogenase family protein molybdopterin-binding subunit [Micromonospora sp. WMMA1363]MDM4719539.1 xanthine dehydrogenase family protein molybdopterin-binding subunit [Micromonospora sp. WMMA1363]